MKYLKNKITATFLCMGIYCATAQAFPIATSGEGLVVTVSSTNPIIATYQGNSALYSNDLYLMLDSSGKPGDDGNLANDKFIFNNHSSPEGSTVNLGGFPVGTELIFRMYVNDTGDNFFTGAASRNPDNHAHAQVQSNWQPNETLVSFEDLFGGSYDYNDLSFSFTNTQATTALGGTATGVGLRSVLCYNVTTGQKVVISGLKGKASWDCAGAGLKINSKDAVKETLSGIAK